MDENTYPAVTSLLGALESIEVLRKHAETSAMSALDEICSDWGWRGIRCERGGHVTHALAERGGWLKVMQDDADLLFAVVGNLPPHLFEYDRESPEDMGPYLVDATDLFKPTPVSVGQRPKRPR